MQPGNTFVLMTPVALHICTSASLNYYLTAKAYPRMFFLTESLFGLDKQLDVLAASVTDSRHSRKIVLKEDIGTGFFTTVSLDDGIKIALTDYTIHRDFSKLYNSSDAGTWCLHINQVKAAEQFTVRINGKEVFFSNKPYSPVFLASSAETFEIKTTPGTYFNQLKIVFPKTWPASHLADLYDPEIMDRYMALEEERLYFDTIDSVYLKLVNRVITEVGDISYLPLVQGIISIIIQRFFFRMSMKLNKRGE
jgi:hypothetical protein